MCPELFTGAKTNQTQSFLSGCFCVQGSRCGNEPSAGIVRFQQWSQTLVQIPVHLRLWRFVSWSRIWRFLVNFIWKPSNVSSALADWLFCSFLLYHAGIWLGIFFICNVVCWRVLQSATYSHGNINLCFFKIEVLLFSCRITFRSIMLLSSDQP